MRAALLILVGVSCAAMLGWRLGEAHRQALDRDNGTLTATPARTFIDGSKQSETGRVSFTLTNQSRRAITILDLERSCTCFVTTGLKGKRLEPAEECSFEIVISIPDRGIDKQRFDVIHDGPDSPLRIGIEVSGKQRLPYVLKVPLKGANFFAIDSTNPSTKFTVITCEPLQGRPWVRALTCDLPDVVVDRIKVLEDITGSVIVKTYIYRIGWAKLPAAVEFHGKLQLEVNDPVSSSISVGTVAGTRLLTK